MKTKTKTRHNFISIVCIICTMAVAFSFSADSTFAVSSIQKMKVKGVKTNVVDNRTVKVSWKKVSGATGYQVYYSKNKNGTYKRGVTVKGSVLNGKVSKLVYGKTYYFKVRAFKKSAGKKKYSKYSKSVKCVIGPAPPKVKALAVEKTTNKIKITFKKSKRASGYEIWRATSKHGKFKKIKVLKASKGSYTNTGLRANKWYYYKVRPFAKRGGKQIKGGFSPAVGETTGGNTTRYNISRISYIGNNKLKGKRILFLGSSVTKGTGSGNVSFVDYLGKRYGVKIVAKEAVGGTKIAYNGANNYCARLSKYGPGTGAQLLVCQLSSNDARQGVKVKVESPIQEVQQSVNDGDSDYISNTENEADDNAESDSEGTIDQNQDILEEPTQITIEELQSNAKSTKSVEDGIKYIIGYSNLVLGCPVVFYTIPPFKKTDNFKSNTYSRMVDLIMSRDAGGDETLDQWAQNNGFEFKVLNMWNDKSFASFNCYNSKSQTRAYYMKDTVHPTKAGYYKKYLPTFVTFLTKEVRW